MAKLLAFESISLDGYFSGVNGDLSWAHKDDPEWNEFVGGNAGGGGRLLLGRVTFEMMEKFWPTTVAAQAMPEVAAGMNRMAKVVFSRTRHSSSWQNTTFAAEDLVSEVRQLKNAAEGIAILGSGSIVTQLADAGLIDEYQIVVTTVALGEGKSLFAGMKNKLNLQLTRSREFKNGNVLLCYQPL